MDGFNLDNECRKGGKYSTLEIEVCTIYSVWLCHGFWAFMGSIFTSTSTGEALTHWWVNIKTKNNMYFILSWTGGGICLKPCKNKFDAIRLGQCSAGVDYNDSKSYSIKEHWKPRKICSIGDLYEWVTKQDCKYNLISNNCKHLAANFYKHS